LDLFDKIFVYNPHKRCTASQILDHPFFTEVKKEYEIKSLKMATN